MLLENNVFVRRKGNEYVSLVKEPASKIVLVCFHFAGGSAQSFLPWKRFCTGVCDLVVAELPGRGRRYGESFFSSMTEAAANFADAYGELSNKHCVFFGHSLGALLAFETARELSARGIASPRRLLVSARAGPDWYPASVGLPELTDTALMKYLRELRGTPQAVLENSGFMQMMMPIIRADLELIYRYEHSPGASLSIPVDVIGAIKDEFVSFESLLRWREATTGDFRLQMVEGGHFTLLAKPDNVYDILNEELRMRLGSMSYQGGQPNYGTGGIFVGRGLPQ